MYLLATCTTWEEHENSMEREPSLELTMQPQETHRKLASHMNDNVIIMTRMDVS